MYITDMYEASCTYADDKYFDNHDYDDDTGDDTDHKNDSYTASGVAPGAGAAPGPYGSHGEGPPVKKARTYGENKTIDRVRCAESHGDHEKVIASKKRWVIAKKQNI